jgi:hypothetical protein
MKPLLDITLVYDTWNNPYMNTDGRISGGIGHVGQMEDGTQRLVAVSGGKEEILKMTFGKATHHDSTGKVFRSPTVTVTYSVNLDPLSNDADLPAGICILQDVLPSSKELISGTFNLEIAYKSGGAWKTGGGGSLLQVDWQVRGIVLDTEGRVKSSWIWLRLKEN